LRFSDQIALIKLEEQPDRVDETGFAVRKTEESVLVFANKKSVGYSEYYKASQEGVKVDLKFDMRSADYNNQEVCVYPAVDGKRYRILKTYLSKNGEFIELTLTDTPEAQQPERLFYG
jgi:SPP1 family predicted phage head-tail adaptor